MTGPVEHRCYRANRCARWASVPGSDQRLGAAINPERGLCDTCTRQLGHALTQLPADYVALHRALADTAGGLRELVSRTAELPIPISASIEALQCEMVHEAWCWAESTAEVLGVTWDTQQAHETLPGRILQRATVLLGDSLSVLLALRGVQHTAWRYDVWTVLTRDGLDGAVALLHLHQRARATTGQTRLVTRLAAPCPRCDTQALDRPDGSDTVTCAACDRRYTWDEYLRLCTLAVQAAA